MKNKRQEMILEIISEEDIDTQEALLDALEKRGVHATQATISRDIRELKLVKSMTSRGNYRYALTARQDPALPKFSSALTESIIRVASSGNMIVIHTYPGMAPAVAACLDGMKLDDLLGCVAGDDTIMAVVTSPDISRSLAEKLRLMIRTL